MVRSILARTLCAFLVASATAAGAAEIVVRNDTIPPAQIIEPPFQDTRFGSLLTLPTSGMLIGVQIVWDSKSGIVPPAQYAAITISNGLTGDLTGLTHPGPTLATIFSPVLVSGITNEFRYLDPGTNLVPLNVPVTAGQALFIDLNVGAIDLRADRGGIVVDIDPVFASGDSLFRNFVHLGHLMDDANQFLPFASQFFQHGDFGIRAIIQPVPEPSTYALAAVGMMTLLANKRRKSRA